MSSLERYAAIRHLSFSRKLRHLFRKGFVQDKRDPAVVDEWATQSCRSCGATGLAFYPFARSMHWRINRGVIRPYLIRAFVVCACGHWKDVS